MEQRDTSLASGICYVEKQEATHRLFPPSLASVIMTCNPSYEVCINNSSSDATPMSIVVQADIVPWRLTTHDSDEENLIAQSLALRRYQVTVATTRKRIHCSPNGFYMSSYAEAASILLDNVSGIVAISCQAVVLVSRSSYFGGRARVKCLQRPISTWTESQAGGCSLSRLCPAASKETVAKPYATHKFTFRGPKELHFGSAQDRVSTF